MSINFFEIAFPDIVFNPEGDTQLCCPFPHQVNNTIFYETNPSAGINLEKNVFHCFSCGRSFSEISFAAAYLHTTYDNAAKFLNILHKAEPIETWDYAEKTLSLNQNIQQLLQNKLRIPEKIQKELHLGYLGGGKENFTIPIVMYGHIVDKVTYRPGCHPKYIRDKNSMSGMICPFDIWRETPKSRKTIICAGEKDMLIARTKGLNAISFTGGENNCPVMFLNEFEDRDVYIIYDNDEVGRMGAKKVALALQNSAKSVHVVDISNVCTGKGEDVWDFFCKYNKSKNDLITIMENTPEYTEEEFQKAKQEIYPITPLREALKPNNVNKTLKSNIQVVATIDATYLAPTLVVGEKTKLGDGTTADSMKLNEVRHWSLNENNYKDLFYLIDSNLKEKAIETYIKTDLLYIPKQEAGVEIRQESRQPIYKCIVTDAVESYSSNAPIEFTAYSLGKKLENSKRYTATYKLVPHPQDGQRLIMVIKDVEESDDFLTTFKVNDSVIDSLKKFQVTRGQTVSEKLDELINLAKGIVKANYNDTLLKVIDIWFHSVLEFSIGNMTDIRGYIDCLVIGESRIGKSSTVEALQKMYGVGKIVSLAGTAATTAGLIGGSNKTTGGAYQTRAGIIPQNNRGGVIFEELIKCKTDLIKELTDIRSSNKVRITRVNGSIELPAYVRMLTLTNSKTRDGVPRPINSYNNGISLLLDIIETPEDIARYDMIAIFGFEASKQIDPFYEPPEPLPQIDYQNRIRWIWSRNQNQVYITKQVYQYTVKQANEINAVYGTFINIFGVEAWKKIMRVAIAIAGYVCSTDETYEKIIVNEEHVDEAIKLLLSLYDNDTFKLKEYVEDEKSYNSLTNEDIDVLEEIWKTSSLLLDYLAKNTQTTRINLQLVSNLENDAFNRVIYKLTRQNLIRIDKTSIYATNKFMRGYNAMDRSVTIRKEVTFNLGEKD